VIQTETRYVACAAKMDIGAFILTIAAADYTETKTKD